MARPTYNAKLVPRDDATASAASVESDFADLDAASAAAVILAYRHRKLSVTDFSSQLWCEMKLYKTLTTGYREESFAMRAGIERHAELERADHDVVEVEVSTREELLGLKMLSTVIMLTQLLPANGKVREVWLSFYNEITDCVIRGVIDEVLLDSKTGKLLLKDTKTRREQTAPSQAQKRTSAIQLQMYLWCLEKARTEELDWNSFFEIYQCDPYAHFQCPELASYACLANLLPVYEAAFKSLPPANDYAVVEYDCEGELFLVEQVPYKRKVLEFAIADMGLFWWNEREPHAVPLHEKWKCKFCPFIQSCQVTPLTGAEYEQAVRDQQLKMSLANDLEELE